MINLVKAFADGIRQANEGDDWVDSNIHASDTSVVLDGDDGKCLRQFWLRYHGYDREPHGPGKLLMFQQGHQLEKIAIKYIKAGLPKGYHIVGQQINVSNGLPKGVIGTLDFMISDGNKYSIIDVKSQRGNAFRYMTDKPKPMHKMQVATYAYAVNNMFNLDINTGGVLPVDREGQNFADDQWFNITQEDFELVEIALNLLQQSISKDMPDTISPKIKINQNKGANSVVADIRWQCKNCDYAGISCPTPIPPKFGDKLGKVVGHIKDGKFIEKIEGISEYIDNYIFEEV